MKQISMFIFIGIVVMVQLGTVVRLCMIRDAKESAKESVKHVENYTLLKFALNEWKSLTHLENEFVYQDYFYDLVMTQVKGDTVFVFAYKDKKETNLVKGIASIYQEASTTSQSVSALIFQFVSQGNHFVSRLSIIVSWIPFYESLILLDSIWVKSPLENPPC